LNRKKLKYIIFLVCFGLIALIGIQLFQIIELSKRKNARIGGLIDVMGKDVSVEYNQINNKIFENYFLNDDAKYAENVSIKDTLINIGNRIQPFLLITGTTIDSATFSKSELRVVLDAEDIEILNERVKTGGGSAELTVNLDDQKTNQLFSRSLKLNRMVLNDFLLYKFSNYKNGFNHKTIDSLIVSYINNNELPQGFYYKLKAGNTDLLFEKRYIYYKAGLNEEQCFRTNLFLQGTNGDSIQLYVSFPDKSGFILKEIFVNLLLSVGLIVLLAISVILLIRTLFFQEELNRSKNDFISNMSHEFKTPISTISLACQALEDKSLVNDVETIQPYISIISEENKRLQQLIEEIIHISEMSANELKMSFQREDLVEIMLDVAGEFSPKISELNGKLLVNIPETDEEIEVIVDRAHIEKAINAILDNALKYSRGIPEVEISLKRTRKNSQIIIKDKGIGISKDYLDKIFDKLYRIPKGNLHSVKGFGIGLSFAKSVFDLHNWQIKVKSIVNFGTTVTITIKKL